MTVVSARALDRYAPLHAIARPAAMVGTALQRSRHLRDCLPQTRERFAGHGRLERYASHTPIHRAGAPLDALMVVIDGVMELSRIGPTGKRHLGSLLPPGQLFGVIPLLDGRPSTHDAWARGPVRVLHVPRETVLQAMAEDPGLSQALLALLCARSRMMLDAISRQALDPLRARTAAAVRAVALARGTHDDGDLALRITQEDIADMLGVTRQSVNRELKALEREGLIRIGKATIEVCDAERLLAVAQARDPNDLSA
jgi:CRP/FNR family cyclic AMP-dependent transcriptional regulator